MLVPPAEGPPPVLPDVVPPVGPAAPHAEAGSPVANVGYLVAAVLFILGIKGMTHPRTAVRGNLLGAAGMLLAVVVTLAITLGLVLAVGLLAGLAAVRAVLRAPLIPALRGD